MEKDNKILIGAVIILLVAIIAFNFSGMTGQVAKEKITTIAISPKTVGAGGIISVSVAPGSSGAENNMRVYYETENGNLMRKESDYEYDRESPAIVRRGVTFDYRTYGTWLDGKYYIAIEDKATGEDIFASFKIAS